MKKEKDIAVKIFMKRKWNYVLLEYEKDWIIYRYWDRFNLSDPIDLELVKKELLNRVSHIGINGFISETN
jgi:hypothetical protein